MAFNEGLFRLGRRHSRILRVWFSIGIGFSLAALAGATVIILGEMARALLLFGGIAGLGDSSFGFSFLVSVTLPSLYVVNDTSTMYAWWNFIYRVAKKPMLSETAGMNMSPSSMGYLCLSSLVCVMVHEFGHALAAASEGVQMEYIAFFFAVVFPGALVAFNDASLQLLSGLASLRIYCAGIWHNAAFCGVCTLALFFLPFLLSPFFIHGESPMVLDVHSMSPLSGYLSAYDVIISLDEFRVYSAEEWKQKITVLTKTPPLSFGQYSGLAKVRNSYCVPRSLIEKSIHVPFSEHETYCPNELFAFAPITCSDPSEYDDGVNKTNHHERGDTIHCLNAKNVIKLRKCAYDPVQTSKNNSGCLCSEDESCLMPMQLPGLGWVEITYSRLECLNSRISQFIKEQHSNGGEKSCHQTFVFVGDLISMANSVHLTSYQPRLSMYFIAYIPDMLERFFTCAFHVSMVLALLNSLPVFFLDGESILEATLLHYCGFLSSSTKQAVLRCCLYGGTSLCAFLTLRTIFISLNK